MFTVLYYKRARVASENDIKLTLNKLAVISSTNLFHKTNYRKVVLVVWDS